MSYDEIEMKFGLEPSNTEQSPFLLPFQCELLYQRAKVRRLDIYNRLDEYNCVDLPLPNDRTGMGARSIIRDHLRSLGKVKPLTMNKAKCVIPQSTSPGLPFTRQGIFKKSEALRLIGPELSIIKRILKTKGHRFVDLYPCVAVARCALGPQPKVRLAWMYPCVVTVLEAMFATPLQELLSSSPYFGWDVNWLAGSSRDVFTGFQSGLDSNLRFNLDWSRFDAHVRRSAIKWAFSILWKLIDISHLSTKEKRFYSEAWKLIVRYFIHTPIVFKNRYYVKTQGVPSGSCFTQIIDTLVNMYYTSDLLMLMAVRSYRSLEELFSYAKFLGDDALCNARVAGQYNSADIIRYNAFYRHGMILSSEKCHFNTNRIAGYNDAECFFLSRELRSSINVIVPLSKVVAQILLPERQDRSPGDVKTRVVCVAWMCGTTRPNWIFLTRVWNYLLETYPDVEPSSLPRDLFRVFTEIFKFTPPLTFPSREEVITRYQSI